MRFTNLVSTLYYTVHVSYRLNSVVLHQTLTTVIEYGWKIVLVLEYVQLPRPLFTTEIAKLRVRSNGLHFYSVFTQRLRRSMISMAIRTVEFQIVQPIPVYLRIQAFIWPQLIFSLDKVKFVFDVIWLVHRLEARTCLRVPAWYCIFLLKQISLFLDRIFSALFSS